MEITASLKERFNAKWKLGDGVDACWVWIGGTNGAKYPYGRISVGVISISYSLSCPPCQILTDTLSSVR